VDHWSPSFGEFLVVGGSGVGSDILVKAEFWAPSAGPTKQRIGGQFSIFSNHSEQDHSPIVGAFGPQ